MLSVVLAVAFVALPLVHISVSRSVPRTALWLGALLAIFGGLVQTSVGWGVSWTLRSLQLAVIAVLLIGIGVAWLRRRTNQVEAPGLRSQITAVLIPVLVIGAVFLVLRLMAGSSVSPLAGFGFLANHPVAEDNAKWLNLTSILVSGRELEYSGGYAGGPYILVLVVAATIWQALSVVLLGGINEVAVTAGAVIGSGFLLIALVPLALSPLLLRRRSKSPPLPAPLLWAGILALATASTVVNSFGHQSLQLAFLMLALFATVFLAGPRDLSDRILGAALATMAAVVWFPLNLYSAAVLAVAIGWVVVAFRRSFAKRVALPWTPLALVALTTVAAWDGLVSSSLYALGLDGGGDVSARSGPLRGAMVGAETASLFDSPGGTEVASAFLGVAAIAAVVAAGLFLRSGPGNTRRLAVALLPLGALALYATLIALADGALTAEGTNYATQKMVFTAAVLALATTLPYALMNLDLQVTGMTTLRWVGVTSVVFLLTLDTMLPRAIASASPELWKANPEDPPYWSVFEAKATSDQPISGLPIACVYLPPGAEKPTANVDGQLAYTCTRLLIGLNGKEGNVGSLMDWISTDWLANGQFWDDWYPNLEGAPSDIRTKRLILLDESSNVIGFETLDGLLRRYPPLTADSITAD